MMQCGRPPFHVSIPLPATRPRRPRDIVKPLWQFHLQRQNCLCRRCLFCPTESYISRFRIAIFAEFVGILGVTGLEEVILPAPLFSSSALIVRFNSFFR